MCSVGVGVKVSVYAVVEYATILCFLVLFHIIYCYLLPRMHSTFCCTLCNGNEVELNYNTLLFAHSYM